MRNPQRQQARLIRRIALLRMISRHTKDERIAVALDELIAETQKRIVTSHGKGRHTATPH